MTCLPDVSVWIDLLVPEHSCHHAALNWYESPEWDRLAFCRITQMGLLRLLTNPHVMGKRVAGPAVAWRMFDQLPRGEGIFACGEPAHLNEAWRELTFVDTGGPNFWTGAYLAAFARSTGYTVVTFDRGFSKYKKVPLRILRPRAV